MRYTLYTLLAATLLVSACKKEKDSYALINNGAQNVRVRFYLSKEDYLSATNILYTATIAPGETQNIPLDNFPKGEWTYKECYTEDLTYASWPEEPTYAFRRTGKGSGVIEDMLAFAPAITGRPGPKVFIGEGGGSHWKALSMNGLPVFGSNYTMTVRKDLTVELHYDTTYIQSTYWFYNDRYQFGVTAPALLVHAEDKFSIFQGENGIPGYMPYFYDIPSAGSDTVIVMCEYDELLFKRVNYL